MLMMMIRLLALMLMFLLLLLFALMICACISVNNVICLCLFAVDLSDRQLRFYQCSHNHHENNTKCNVQRMLMIRNTGKTTDSEKSFHKHDSRQSNDISNSNYKYISLSLFLSKPKKENSNIFVWTHLIQS